MNKMPKCERKKVVFVRSNLLDRDIRLLKEIRALNNEEYTFKLLCWDRECKTNKIEKHEILEEMRLRLKAPWGKKVLPFFPIWWSFVFFHLMVSKWDVVHAVNFDCIIPSLIAGRLKRKTIIYEILDIYEDTVILPKPIRTICINVDKLFMRFATAVVVADEMQIEGVGGIPNNKVIPIYDSPPDIFIKNDNNGYNYQKNKPIFKLFYAGVLFKAKRLNLDKVIEAIKDIEDVKLVIAGYGDLAEEIEELSHQESDKVEFIGKITYEEVIERGLKADLFFILRDPIRPANRYTCGSTLFNAMICGKPILANKGSSTTAKVYEAKCGLVVDANNIEEIKEAIIKLRDNPELCEELGANARRAYEQKYSWEIMEKRLLTLYQNLTDEIGQRKKREQNNGELSRQ